MIYPAKIDVLDELLSYVEGELDKNDVPSNIIMSFLVSVEEIFVNIASYAYPNGNGDADVVLDIKDRRAKIVFSDSGIEFNPLAKPDPDVTMSAEERGIGGLGIYMVKKTMDGVEYQYSNQHNILSFWKDF